MHAHTQARMHAHIHTHARTHAHTHTADKNASAWSLPEMYITQLPKSNLTQCPICSIVYCHVVQVILNVCSKGKHTATPSLTVRHPFSRGRLRWNSGYSLQWGAACPPSSVVEDSLTSPPPCMPTVPALPKPGAWQGSCPVPYLYQTQLACCPCWMWWLI